VPSRIPERKGSAIQAEELLPCRREGSGRMRGEGGVVASEDVEVRARKEDVLLERGPRQEIFREKFMRAESASWGGARGKGLAKWGGTKNTIT